MQNFDLLFYDSYNPMWVFDISSLRILEVNNAAVKEYGYSKKEFLTKTIMDLRPTEDVDKVKLVLTDIRTSKTYMREFRHMNKAGNIFHVQVMSYPINFDGKESRLVVTQNIEHLKDITGQLEITQSKLNRMLETTSIGFFQVDKRSVITYWNRAAEQMIGYDRKYLLGKNIWQVFPEAVDTNFYVKYQEAIEKQENTEFESYFWPIQKWFAFVIYFIDEGLVIHFRDITETKMYEEKLLEKIEQLKEISYLNSHYIRKPVASLLGLTSLINQNLVKGKEYKSIATQIHDCSQELDNVIHRVNSKVNDEIEVTVNDQIQDFSLDDLVEKVTLEASAFYPSHRIVLKNKVEVPLYGNKHAIGAALHRLIDNAVKFSANADLVEVCLDVVQHNAIISVRDFGAGIDKQMLSRIFISFNNKKVSSELGTGLAKVSNVAHRHNGDVWVESQPGVGSIFYLRLPMSNIAAIRQGRTTDFSYYEAPGLEITDQRRQQIIVANWQGFHTLHTAKTGCLRILNRVNHSNAKLVLNDNTNVAGTWNDAVEWVSTTFLPMLSQSGITHLAWVYSPSTFSRLSADTSIEKVAGLGINIQTFGNTEDAKQWLENVLTQ